MRVTRVGLVAVVVLATVMMGGCTEPLKRENEELTRQNQDLQTELERARADLDAKEASLNRCREDLASAQNRMSGLQGELGKLREQAALPKGWEVKQGMVMTSLPSKVLFDSGSAKLKSGAATSLSRIQSEIARNFSGYDVYVMGHTDTDPIRKSKWKDNIELSVQRAAAVTRYLISHGMNAKQIIVSGCGEYRPVAPNTGSGKARNRRVEFWVYKPM